MRVLYRLAIAIVAIFLIVVLFTSIHPIRFSIPLPRVFAQFTELSCPVGSGVMPNGSVRNPATGNLRFFLCVDNNGNVLFQGTITGPLYFTTGIPQFDVRGFCAQGSNASTTGTISAGSNSLLLAAAIDFSACPAGSPQSGPGIRIASAGPLNSLAVPTGLTVSAQGTTGATSYQYQISAVDVNNGQTTATSVVSIANGNATLSQQNFNHVTWNTVSNAVWYAVYGRTSGSMVYMGWIQGVQCSGTCTFNDYGTNQNPYVYLPPLISNTPPGAATNGWLLTTIASGFGTVNLVLSSPASNTVTGVAVNHDDGAAIQAAVNAVPTTFTFGLGGVGGRIVFSIPQNGNSVYPVSGPITITNANQHIWFDCPQARLGCVIVGTNQALDIFQINVSGSAYLKWSNLSFYQGGVQVHFLQPTGFDSFDTDVFNNSEGIKFEANAQDIQIIKPFCQTDTWCVESANGTHIQDLTIDGQGAGEFGQGNRDNWVRFGNLGNGDSNIRITNMLGEGPPNALSNPVGAIQIGGATNVTIDNFQLADWNSGCPGFNMPWFSGIYDGGGNGSPANVLFQNDNITTACGDVLSTQGSNMHPIAFLGGNYATTYGGGLIFGGANPNAYLQISVTGVGSFSPAPTQYGQGPATIISSFIGASYIGFQDYPLGSSSTPGFQENATTPYGIIALAFATKTNCNVNSTSPAACGSAASGDVVVPTTTTSYTVNTTAVTANSRIRVFPITDNSGLSGSPTCNAPPTPFVGYESGRVAGTSFTFTLPSTTGTSCWNYVIIN